MALPGNERNFGFDFGNAHIIAWIAIPGSKKAGLEAVQWLTDDLKQKAGSTWTFAAFHHPLFSAHVNRSINTLRWIGADLSTRANRVDAVLRATYFYAAFRMAESRTNLKNGVLS